MRLKRTDMHYAPAPIEHHYGGRPIHGQAFQSRAIIDVDHQSTRRFAIRNRSGVSGRKRRQGDHIDAGVHNGGLRGQQSIDHRPGLIGRQHAEADQYGRTPRLRVMRIEAPVRIGSDDRRRAISKVRDERHVATENPNA